MKLKAGIVFGVAVVVWQLIYGFLGLYKNPSMGFVVILVDIVITFGVMFWALKHTAAQGNRYGAQVLTALVIALIGGVIILAGSFLFTTVLFPDYKDLAIAQAVEQYENQGWSEERIDQAMPMVEAMVSPMAQAILGFVMTVITGVVAGLIIGFFVREK